MDTDRPARPTRGDGVIRGMLGLVLLAAVLWALAGGSSDAPVFDFAQLPGL